MKMKKILTRDAAVSATKNDEQIGQLSFYSLKTMKIKTIKNANSSHVTSAILLTDTGGGCVSARAYSLTLTFSEGIEANFSGKNARAADGRPSILGAAKRRAARQR